MFFPCINIIIKVVDEHENGNFLEENWGGDGWRNLPLFFYIYEMKKHLAYIFLAILPILLCADHFYSNGLEWTDLIYFFISSMFLLQIKYQLNLADKILGTLILGWSTWMLIAFLVILTKNGWNPERILLAVILILSVLAAIALLKRRPSPIAPTTTI